MARSQELAHLFQLPDSPVHRRYEICRAYFYESAAADEIAKRFHLHSCSVRAIVRDFARDPDVNSLFTDTKPGPKASPKRDAICERACELRRRGATLANIRAVLGQDGFDVSESYLFRLLAARVRPWPRRDNIIRHRNRESTPTTIPSCRTLPTSGSWRLSTDGSSLQKSPASSCFFPCCWTSTCPRPSAMRSCPARSRSRRCSALLALLAPKLIGKRRISHICDLCNDEGAGLFAGLNVLPKTTYATDYSYKTERVMTQGDCATMGNLT